MREDAREDFVVAVGAVFDMGDYAGKRDTVTVEEAVE
jgi:hypothetical protein